MIRIPLLVLLVVALFAVAPTPLVPAERSTAQAATSAALAPPLTARGGGRVGGGGRIGSRARRPLTPAQRRAQQRRTQQRNRAVGRAFRGVLRILGIAFLLNLLFGWGPGGSAWGLLLLAGLVALFVVSRRRRRQQFAHPRY